MPVSKYIIRIIALSVCCSLFMPVYAQRRQGMEEVIKDSAMLLEYKQRIIPLQQANKTAELAQTYKRIADYCYKRSLNDSMTIYYKLALREYEKVKDSFFIAYCYVRIGEELAYTGKNKEISLNWLLPAASYFERSGEYLLAAHTVYDISLTYKAVGSEDLRQKSLSKAIELNKLARDTLLEIIILLAEADELRKKNKWNAAHTKTLIALDKSVRTNNGHFRKVSLFQLGEDHMHSGQPGKAISLFMESLSIKATPREMITEVYWRLAICHIQLKNSNEAEKYLGLYKHAADSVAKRKEKDGYDELLLQYESEKKQATIVALERENHLREKLAANQKILILSLTAGLIIVLATGFIFYRNFKKRQRLEKELGSQRDEFNLQLQEEREQKLTAEFNKQLAEVQLTALSAQMNPHFIFNCMNSIQKYILKNEKNKALDFLQNFSELMRSVLDNSAKAKVGLDEEISMLEKYILLEQLRLDNKFDFRIDIAPDLQTDFFEIPGMIIQPYVENAIWHGLMNLPDRQAGLPDEQNAARKGLLQMKFVRIDTTIRCIVEDNGVGRKMAAKMEEVISPRRRSFGMNLSQKRLELLGKENESIPEILVEDLESADHKPSGTRVTIFIHYD